MRPLGQEDPLERKWQPAPAHLLGNPLDRGGWQVAVRGVTESGTTEHAHTRALQGLVQGGGGVQRGWGAGLGCPDAEG